MTDQHTPEEPQPPVAAEAEGWRRLHPLSPVVRGGLVILAVVGVLFVNLRDALFQGLDPFDADADLGELGFDPIFGFGWGTVLAVVVGGVLLVLVVSWLLWRSATFRITESYVEARRGIIFRSHRRAPLARIQSVNIFRPLVARFLGLSGVTVETADADGNVKLEFLAHEDAERVRREVLRVARAVQNEGSAAGAHVAAAVDTGLDPGGIDPVTQPERDPAGPARDGAAFDGAAFDGPALDGPEPFEPVVQVPRSRLIGSTLLSPAPLFSLMLAIPALILVFVLQWTWAWFVVFPLLFAVAGQCYGLINRGWDFQVGSTQGAIRTNSGLTSTGTNTTPLKRIHGLELSQPLWWKPFNWWRVQVTTTGFSLSGASNPAQSKTILLPIGTREEALRVTELALPGMVNIHELTAELDGQREGWITPVSRAWPVTLLAHSRIGIKLDAAGNGGREERDHRLDTDARASSGDRLENGWSTPAPSQTPPVVRIAGGAITQWLSVVPILRTQSVDLSRSPVHRLCGATRLDIRIVLGTVRTYARGLDSQDARQLFDRIRSAMVDAQRTDAERTHERLLERADPEASGSSA